MPEEGTGPPGRNTGIVLSPIAKCPVRWYSRGLTEEPLLHRCRLLGASKEPVFYTFQAERLQKKLKQAQPNQKQCRQVSGAIQQPLELPSSARGKDAGRVPAPTFLRGKGGLSLSINRSSDIWLANAVLPASGGLNASRFLISGLVLISGEGLGLFPLLLVALGNWKLSGC